MLIPMSFLTFVLGFFQSFHMHMRSLLRIHDSRSLNTLAVSANAIYPYQALRYLLSFSIRFSIEYGLLRELMSRTLSFIRFMLAFAIRSFRSLLEVKLKPRNLRFHGRSTADLLAFTFNFSFPSINEVTDFMTR